MSKSFLSFLLLLFFFSAKAQKAEFISPVGHNGLINVCRFSPNGKYLATAGGDGNLKLWEPYSSQLVHTFNHPADIVNDIAFSPDGLFIATGCDDGMVDMWSVTTGKLIFRIQAHTLYCKQIAFSKDGRLLISTSSNGDPVKVWDAYKGTLVKKFPEDPNSYSSFSATGNEIIVSYADGTVRIYNIKNGQLIHQYNADWRVAFNAGRSLFGYTHKDSLLIRNTSTGKLLQTFKEPGIYHFDFTGNNNVVLFSKGHLKKYELTSGKLIFDEPASDTSLNIVAVAPNEKTIILNAANGTRKIINGITGKLITALPTQISYYSPYDGTPYYESIVDVSFSPDEKLAAIQTYDNTIIWDLTLQKQISICKSHTKTIAGSYLSSKNNLLFTSLEKYSNEDPENLLAFDTKKSLPAYKLEGKYLSILKDKMDSNETIFTYTDTSGRPCVMEMATGKTIYTYPEKGFSRSLSKDGKLLLINEKINDATIIDLKSQKQIFSIPNYDFATFNPEGNLLLAIRRYDTMIMVFDINKKLAIDSVVFSAKEHPVDLAFSEDGKKLVVTWRNYESEGRNLSVIDFSSKKILLSFDDKYDWIEDFSIQPDGKKLLVFGTKDLNFSLWDVEKAKKISIVSPHNAIMYGVRFVGNSSYFVTMSNDEVVFLWETSSLKKINTFHGVRTFGINIKNDSLLLNNTDGSVDIISLKNNQPIVKFLVVDTTEWTVTTSDGLFDASAGAAKLSHFVVNDATDKAEPWKIIEFNQLKHRYYQPGLLPITLGLSDEKRREVPKLSDVPLPPFIKAFYEKNKLTLQLTDKGGGIGKTAISLNNAEIIENAVTVQPDSKKNQTITINVDLEKYSHLLNADEKNIIKVLAFNKENWLSSQPEILSFIPSSATKGIEPKRPKDEVHTKPHLYAVICGTSNYAGTALDLTYSSKDALDFSHALKIGAEKLFGKEYVHISTLQSGAASDFLPTKENFLRIFNSFDSTRKDDIFLVYLSGHGINYGGQDGDFYYLLSGASAADPSYFNDPQVRQTLALSSNELTKLFNEKKAGKKILILDACASGKAAENMAVAMREVPASQVRALDRMADRTGFYVLSGAASDAVSYETSVYGQGLLTYSLLKSMRGAALRRDGNEEYVDLQKMLQYAVDEVPVLARGIGGIQQPLYRSPGDQKSFDIGRIDEEIKKQIILSEPKPVFIASSFINETKKRDDLKVSEIINSQLREITAKGKHAELLFLEAKDYPDAWQLSGTYKIDGENIAVDCMLFKNDHEKNIIVKGLINNLSQLATDLIAEVKKGIH